MGEKIESAVIEQRGGNVGCAAKAAPGDLACARDVPRRAVESNGQQGSRIVAAAGKDHPVGGQWGSDNVRGKSATFPENLAAAQVISADAAGAAHNHLRLARM